MKKLFSPACLCIAAILASAFLSASEPPKDLARKVAHRESKTEAERNQYTYRQFVRIQEMDNRGAAGGEYRETRDVIFSPTKEREDVALGEPVSTLKRLVLTPEDFHDLRDIQPFVLTSEMMHIYETKFRGEERVEDEDCWVLEVRPRQILQGQRLFDGLIWIKKDDDSVVRSEGRAVPQIVTTKSENLFPRFTTIRRKVNGYWFPVYTIADDTLHFRNGAIHIKLTIRYDDYKKFGSNTTVTFGEAAPK